MVIVSGTIRSSARDEELAHVRATVSTASARVTASEVGGERVLLRP